MTKVKGANLMATQHQDYFWAYARNQGNENVPCCVLKEP